MLRKFWVLIPLLLAVGGASFFSWSEEAKSTYSCPLCGKKFEAASPSKASFNTQFSESKSMDSDFCPYGEAGSSLMRMVVTCPNCMYSTYGKEFSQSVREEQKAQVRSVLKDNPRPASVKEGEVVPWLGWLYAGRCYKITRRDILFAGQTFHGAAYCARIQATPLVAENLSIEGPETTLTRLEELEKKISEENSKQDRMKLMMIAAQAAQRGGFVEMRDKWVSRLRKEAAGDRAVQEQIKTFTSLVAAEEQCLEEALACYQAAMYAGKIPSRNRTLYDYLIADIMRRLGRRRSPIVAHYARVIEDNKARPDLKRLANYFIECLSKI